MAAEQSMKERRIAARASSENNPEEAWAVNAPTRLTKRMVEEFPDREPIWGWRDDGKAIDERAIREDPLNKGLELFLIAKNDSRMKFCLLVAGYSGFEIKGTVRPIPK
jgi:hypothetical protein